MVKVFKYSALDVTIGDVSTLGGAKVHVSVTESGKDTIHFLSPINFTTSLRRKLSASGVAKIGVAPIILNNKEYSFGSQTKNLAPSLLETTFANPKVTDVDISTFKDLPVVADNEFRLGSVFVRLSSASYIYEDTVDLKQQSPKIGIKVAPGKYDVQTKNFVAGGIVYIVSPPYSKRRWRRQIKTRAQGARRNRSQGPQFPSLSQLRWQLQPGQQSQGRLCGGPFIINLQVRWKQG